MTVDMLMEFLINEVVHSLNSGNLINHWNMNCSQFKDPLCYLYLHGTVISSMSFKQEDVGSSLSALFLQKCCHWTQGKSFRESHSGKTPIRLSLCSRYPLTWIQNFKPFICCSPDNQNQQTSWKSFLKFAANLASHQKFIHLNWVSRK